MRMIYNVIDRMLSCIPRDEQKQYADMIIELMWVREDTLYKAPEQMPEYFEAVANILNNYLGEPDSEWKQEIADIFGDKK